MNIIKKIITGWIILLLTGFSYSSALSVDTKSIIDESENDCGCDVSYKNDFVIINKLLNRLEFKINLIKARFSFIPNFVEKCNDILEIVESDSPFCIFLDNLLESLGDLYFPLYELKDTLSGNPILYYICVYSAGFIFIIGWDIFIIGMFLCGWHPYYLHLLEIIK